MSINALNTVGEIAVAVPGATRVFERMGIDYCCGGGRTLEDACRRVNQPVDDVLHTLAELESTPGAGEGARVWGAETMSALAGYIVDRHHLFTRDELARLENLFAKVGGVHGERHPELIEAGSLFSELKAELIQHMLKEEQVLFPYIERLEAAVNEGRQPPQPFFGTVRHPVRMMTAEHDAAGEMLARLRAVTSSYAVPDDACISYRTLYQAMREFEEDLHLHIHLENNILFPRAVDFEAAYAGEATAFGGESSCMGRHPM